MTFDLLRNNIKESKKIIIDLKKVIDNLKYSDPQERAFNISIINSFYSRLKMINSSIPEIVGKISAAKKLDNSLGEFEGYIPRGDFVKVSYTLPTKGEKSVITLRKEDKEKFLKELSLSEANMKKLGSDKRLVDLNRPNKIAEISNNIFGKISFKIGNHMPDLKKDLREANSKFLLVSYISIALLFSSLIFLASLIFVGALVFVDISNIAFIWAPFLFAFICLVGFYLYPSIEKSNFEQGITNELPFATIYMASIAGSNIDPTKIFKIIAESSEYRNIGIEMKKLINQIEIYGYDLVTALKNISKSTNNKKFSELLGGMATSISSGSSLKNFLEKKSENLLTDYKLEREKYTSVAATYMDVYISILITAPVILVLVVVIMGLTDLKLGGFTVDSLVAMAIGAVVIMNLFYLLFLQIKQPKT